MVLLKRVIGLLGIVVVIITGLYFYYLYVPVVSKPNLSGDFQQRTIGVGEQSRSFSWYKPKNISSPGKKSTPLIFVLHGSNGSGERIRLATAYEFDTLAEQYGYIVVYPDGYKNHWNDCRASADYAANKKNIDDIAFFQAMIDFFIEREQVDRQQVFVTGMSNGGQMAYRLALETPELFSAFAPIAASLPVDSNLDCKKSAQPVSIAIFNGVDDSINPYQGGVVQLSGNSSRGEVLSTVDTASYWRELAGVNDQPLEKTFPEVDGLKKTSVIEQRWGNSSPIKIRLYRLQGSGHVIPSKITRPPRIVGQRAGDISGPEEIVKFFLSL